MAKNNDLLKACAKGNKTEVLMAFRKSFLSKSANPNAMEVNGDTALILACKQSHQAIVLLLIEKGANLNKSNLKGETALYITIENKQWELTRLLIEHGADPNTIWPYRKGTVLMKVALAGNQEMVSLLLEKGANPNCQNSVGETALFFTVQNQGITELLIKHGADVNIKATDGRTLLSETIKSRSLDTTNYVIQHGAILDFSSSAYLDTFNACIKEENLDFVKLFVESGININPTKGSHTPLMCAAMSKSGKCLDYLLNSGADINALDHSQSSPLILACSFYNSDLPQVIELLIDHGANVNHQDNSGWSALFTAVHNKKIESAKILIEHRADINANAKTGESIFRRAMAQSLFEIVRLLLIKGAILDLSETDLEDLYIEACRECDDKDFYFINLLESKGLDLKRSYKKYRKISSGYQALHQSVQSNKLNLVKYLISKGVNVNEYEQEKYFDSVLNCACRHGYVDIVAYLLSVGADLQVKNSGNEPAILQARLSNDFTAFSQILSLAGQYHNPKLIFDEKNIQKLWNEYGDYYSKKEEYRKEMDRILNQGRESTAKGSIGHDKFNVKTEGRSDWESRCNRVLFRQNHYTHHQQIAI